MRRTANRRLSGPLLVPSPELTGWSMIVMCASVGAASSTLPKAAKGISGGKRAAISKAVQGSLGESTNV